MNPYILRRNTRHGFRWFIVEPSTDESGRLKRKCIDIGDTDHAREFLMSDRHSDRGKHLFHKFLISLEESKMSSPRAPTRYLIQYQGKYYGGSTSSLDNPIKWVTNVKSACKFSPMVVATAIKNLNRIYGYPSEELIVVTEDSLNIF